MLNVSKNPAQKLCWHIYQTQGCVKKVKPTGELTTKGHRIVSSFSSATQREAFHGLQAIMLAVAKKNISVAQFLKATEHFSKSKKSVRAISCALEKDGNLLEFMFTTQGLTPLGHQYMESMLDPQQKKLAMHLITLRLGAPVFISEQ